MISLSLFTLLGVFCSVSITQEQSCNNDNDCLDESKCQHGMCKNCLNCKILFRKGTECVLDFQECGECLNGYEDVLVTHTSVALKPCRPLKNTTKCLSDEDCPNNMYCLEEICANCFNCHLINRISPSRGCAKQLEDCGSCMLGFYDVPVTIGSSLKPCEKKLIDSSDKPNWASLPFDSHYILALWVVMLIFFCTLWLCLKNSKRAKSSLSNVFKMTAREMVEPSAPPLGKSFYSLYSAVSCEPEVRDGSSCRIVNERKQTAKVFKLPDAPYYVIDEQTPLDRRESDLHEIADLSDTAEDVNDSNPNDNTHYASSQQENVGEVDHSSGGSMEGDVIFSGSSAVEVPAESISPAPNDEDVSEENCSQD